MSADGRPIAVAVLDIVRVEGGAFAEQWGGPDLFDLLLQLGAAVPLREQAAAEPAPERTGARDRNEP